VNACLLKCRVSCAHLKEIHMTIARQQKADSVTFCDCAVDEVDGREAQKLGSFCMQAATVQDCSVVREICAGNSGTGHVYLRK
jgi:hypothetical protein